VDSCPTSRCPPYVTFFSRDDCTPNCFHLPSRLVYWSMLLDRTAGPFAVPYVRGRAPPRERYFNQTASFLYPLWVIPYSSSFSCPPDEGSTMLFVVQTLLDIFSCSSVPSCGFHVRFIRETAYGTVWPAEHTLSQSHALLTLVPTATCDKR